MRRRQTQYKRNPKLKRQLAKHRQAANEHVRRLLAWERVLRNNPSDHVINRIADLLARLGFEPDKHGIPSGDWPPITRTNPLVLLDSWAVSYRYLTDESKSGRYDTLAWKEDVLEAATLVWAGIIEFEEEQIQQVCPLAAEFEVLYLLNHSDLEAYWKRRGVGMTAADIREKWEQGERIVPSGTLSDSLRRAKGGT